MSCTTLHNLNNGLPRVRCIASPDSVRLHKVSASDTRPYSYRLARPLSQCHIADSLFATYPVLPHTSSRLPVTITALVLLVLSYRPITANVLLPVSDKKIGVDTMPGTP